MYTGLYNVIRDHIVDGALSIPVGIQHAIATSAFAEARSMLPSTDALRLVKVFQGAANNLPDEASMEGARAVKEVVGKVGADDILVVLISGGGSALLPAPVPGISLSDKLKTIKLISEAGGTIQDLNTVRMNLSELKGGKLTELCASSNIIALILSDIINDPLDLIASGPTMMNVSTFSDCLQIFEKLRIASVVPLPVINFLRHSARASDAANNFSALTPSRQSSTRSVQNLLVGSNITAIDSALKKAIEMGFKPIFLSRVVSGEASSVGNVFALLLLSLLKERSTYEELTMWFANAGVGDGYAILETARDSAKVCFIAGGETTVHVRGKGTGGRNQEIVLAFLCRLLWHRLSLEFCAQFCFLSAGTDGQDGPTDAAGACCTNDCLSSCLRSNLDPLVYLQANNSYEFFSTFESGRFHYKTGLTGTNVMDLQILLVDNTHAFA